MKLSTPALVRSPLDQHLAQLGWQRLEYAGAVYQLGQGGDAARLESIALQGSGTRFRLDAPRIALPSAAEHLSANAALAGPIKFVEDGGEIACVADLPLAVLADESEFAGSAGDSPASHWAACLTALARGKQPDAGESSTPAQIARSLESAGYTASIDGSGVKLTLVLPGRFVEIAIEPDQPCGLKLSLPLADCSGQSPAVIAAARRLAQEVNRRVLLLRVSEPQPGVSIAEVRLTMSRVQEAWLLAAIESLATAAGLVLRPLAALQDPALAALVTGLN
jgi:hypothetical protein